MYWRMFSLLGIFATTTVEHMRRTAAKRKPKNIEVLEFIYFELKCFSQILLATKIWERICLSMTTIYLVGRIVEVKG